MEYRAALRGITLDVLQWAVEALPGGMPKPVGFAFPGGAVGHDPHVHSASCGRLPLGSFAAYLMRQHCGG